MWVDQGKPKEGLCCDEVKNAKYKYKLAIKDAVSDFENRYNDNVLECLIGKDMISFWKIRGFQNKR